MDKNNPYVMFNLEAFNKALAELKQNEFKLWIYLAKNQKSMTNWILQRATCQKALGIANATFDSARLGLIEKGYLVDVDGDGKNYVFIEMPGMKHDDDQPLYGF